MKRNIIIAAIAATLTLATCDDKHNDPQPAPKPQDELSLYNKEKHPVAYINYEDGQTIYLWDGTPVAYLVPFENEKSPDEDKKIYGFNGQHLGWYDSGVVWDINGNAVGARQGVVRGKNIDMSVVFVPEVKSVKHVRPVKKAKVAPTAEPAGWADYWGELSLTDFLKQGIKE